MEDFSETYQNLLFYIGIAATYSGMYDHARIIHELGAIVAPGSNKVILGITQNEALQENYETALAEIEKWEAVNPGFAFLSWWKGLILKISDREHEALQMTYKIREQGREDLANLLATLKVPNK